MIIFEKLKGMYSPPFEQHFKDFMQRTENSEHKSYFGKLHVIATPLIKLIVEYIV